MRRKVYQVLAILLTGVIFLSGCSSNVPASNPGTPTPRPSESPASTNPEVTIEMESGGKIVIELYPDKAPNTVKNFVALVQDGFYDGLIFHRVIDGFMIQGGDPTGSGMGGPDYSIKGEFSSNGFAENDLSHTPGVISMARSQAKDSAGCQFFICDSDGDATFLDGDYAAFGQVISGMEEVERISAVKTDSSDRPTKEERMKTVTVDLKGQEIGSPEVIKK